MSRGTACNAASAIRATSGKFFQQSATISAVRAVPGSPSQERYSERKPSWVSAALRAPYSGL